MVALLGIERSEYCVCAHARVLVCLSIVGVTQSIFKQDLVCFRVLGGKAGLLLGIFSGG